jgi:hypothetical protein
MCSSSNAPVDNSARREAHEIPELKIVCDESTLINRNIRVARHADLRWQLGFGLRHRYSVAEIWP